MSISLASLGVRICIIGPSSSGKSTLATHLGQKITGKICHLDQLAHKQNTNWQRRPDADFIADHDAFIKGSVWVIDGNYSICMPQRFARSTAIIFLDLPITGCLWRYVRRSFEQDEARKGNLAGATQQFNVKMLKYIALGYQKNHKKYETFLKTYNKPVVRIRSFKELKQYYALWELTR